MGLMGLNFPFRRYSRVNNDKLSATSANTSNVFGCNIQSPDLSCCASADSFHACLYYLRGGRHER